jgi:hypothetical protein
MNRQNLFETVIISEGCIRNYEMRIKLEGKQGFSLSKRQKN